MGQCRVPNFKPQNGGFWTSCRQCQHLNTGRYLFQHFFRRWNKQNISQKLWMHNVTKQSFNCIQWTKRLMSMPRRWQPPVPRIGLTVIFLGNLCPAFVSFFLWLNRKIQAPRLLVTVRVFCLFHTASKFTQSYHFGAKKIFIWGEDQPPAPHSTPISIYRASPPYWNPKYATFQVPSSLFDIIAVRRLNRFIQ